MPTLTTLYFDQLEYSDDAAFQFAAGIPGFEEHTAFLFIQQPHTNPLVFMQSLQDPAVCFIGLPAKVVDSDYHLELSPEEAIALGMPAGETSRIEANLLSLVLLTFAENTEPVANLMSPIVLNLQTHRGIQAIQLGSSYSLRHPLVLEQAAACS
ncbi:MAG TPA: flagellar assembly protein FliW [Bryobacteraceae bacterium]|nr:flagellar assembly protein FliW [Bryobacteraceae bacterium]